MNCKDEAATVLCEKHLCSASFGVCVILSAKPLLLWGTVTLHFREFSSGNSNTVIKYSNNGTCFVITLVFTNVE